MRLHELVAVRQYRDRSFHDVISDFCRAGGEVSNGRQGTVLWFPGWTHVFKVFPSDPEYLRFVRWAKRNQALPALPRVLGGPKRIVPFYARRVGEAPWLYVVKLERLFPLTDAELARNVGAWVEDDQVSLPQAGDPEAVAGARAYRAAFAAREAAGIAEWPAARRALLDLTHWRSLAESLQRWEAHPTLKAVSQAYAALLAAGVKGAPDMHGKNFMQRADGTLVMTDPLWAGETPYQAYDRAMRAEMDFGDDEDPEPDPYNTIPGGKLRAKMRPKRRPREIEMDMDLPF